MCLIVQIINAWIIIILFISPQISFFSFQIFLYACIFISISGLCDSWSHNLSNKTALRIYRIVCEVSRLWRNKKPEEKDDDEVGDAVESEISTAKKVPQVLPTTQTVHYERVHAHHCTTASRWCALFVRKTVLYHRVRKTLWTRDIQRGSGCRVLVMLSSRHGAAPRRSRIDSHRSAPRPPTRPSAKDLPELYFARLATEVEDAKTKDSSE